MNELLSTEEMRRADAAAIAAGTSGTVLMEAAGRAVAHAVRDLLPDGRRVLVLAGPGNNGGDGYVAARSLAEAGLVVTVAALGEPSALVGDAAWARALWHGPVVPLAQAPIETADVVVDALFGAGLSRPLDGIVAESIHRVAASGRPVVAVDVPSGVSGDTGQILGIAAPARMTITFGRLKPGHLLLPGREFCGEVRCADIGLSDAVISHVGARAWRNVPGVWRAKFPQPRQSGHKYTRGHVLVVSGPEFATGAARLAARAALRVGAGLVTLAGDRSALRIHAAHETAIMLTEAADARALGALLEAEPRYRTVVIGPAAGREPATRDKVSAILARARNTVLDADALTGFSGEAEALAALIRTKDVQAVVTPHEGEFGRLFSSAPYVLAAPSKLERARLGAALLGAVCVLKGPDTVVAAPDGRSTIAANAPPWLATAGSGDVLAGMIAGLLAQGMPPFEAASAAVWLHGEAARAFGPGLISEDLPGRVPGVLVSLLIASEQL